MIVIQFNFALLHTQNRKQKYEIHFVVINLNVLNIYYYIYIYTHICYFKIRYFI